MGRKKREPGEGATYITFGCYAEELAAIEQTMARWGISQSAAIRLLVRTGFQRGPKAPEPPFTPLEGDTDRGH